MHRHLSGKQAPSAIPCPLRLRGLRNVEQNNQHLERALMEPAERNVPDGYTNFEERWFSRKCTGNPRAKAWNMMGVSLADAEAPNPR